MKRHLPFALILFAVTSAFAALPSIPGTNEVIRYECDALYELGAGNDDFKTIPRDRGDALLSALGGGQQLEEIHYPPGMEVIPAPPRYWLNLILTNLTRPAVRGLQKTLTGPEEVRRLQELSDYFAAADKK